MTEQEQAPLSEAELQAIQVRLGTTITVFDDEIDEPEAIRVRWCDVRREDVRRLLADLRRCRAALARLANVGTSGYPEVDDMEDERCAYCGEQSDAEYIGGAYVPYWPHKPDCPVAEGRRAFGPSKEAGS